MTLREQDNIARRLVTLDWWEWRLPTQEMMDLGHRLREMEKAGAIKWMAHVQKVARDNAAALATHNGEAPNAA